MYKKCVYIKKVIHRNEPSFRYSRIAHKHLNGHPRVPIMPHCLFDILTIHHILNESQGLRHLYRMYFNLPFPTSSEIIGKTPTGHFLVLSLKLTSFCFQPLCVFYILHKFDILFDI